jgi:peptidoglycan/xylan/chitin deacetylase (PgdA/CDA1 family)
VRLAGVPVLLYHGLTAGGVTPSGPWQERQYWVAARRFAEHMQAIRAARLESWSLRQVWEAPDGTIGAGVALTFDDGRTSDYATAYPALAAAGLRAEFFLNTATVGRPGFLTWAQIREMQQGGMGFQSHGHEHVDLRRLPDAELRRGLVRSKASIEERLGQPVEFLAAPFGRLDGRVLLAAREAGYRAVCTSRARPARPGSGVIDRVAVYASTRARALGRLIHGHPGLYALRALRALGLGLPRWMSERVRPPRVAAQPAETYP